MPNPRTLLIVLSSGVHLLIYIVCVIAVCASAIVYIICLVCIVIGSILRYVVSTGRVGMIPQVVLVLLVLVYCAYIIRLFHLCLLLDFEFVQSASFIQVFRYIWFTQIHGNAYMHFEVVPMCANINCIVYTETEMNNFEDYEMLYLIKSNCQ